MLNLKIIVETGSVGSSVMVCGLIKFASSHVKDDMK